MASGSSRARRRRSCGCPLARYIRETTLGTIPKVRRSAADDALIRELARIGNNLKQLARDANAAEWFALEADVDATLRALRDAIGRLA